MLWIGEVHRQLGAVLFTQQPIAVSLGLAAIAGWMLLIPRDRTPGTLALTGVMIVLAAATALFFGWLAVDYQAISMMAIRRPEWMAWISGAVLAGILVLVWRHVGIAIAAILIALGALALWGFGLGIPTVALDRLTLYLITDPSGLLNLPLRVALEIVVPFIFFGRLLEVSGGSTWFTELSQAVLGHYRGGAAKVSVAASALFGSVSGNAVSNVVGTGVITIPLMTRSGYQPRMAGAIEAVASTGGQLLPPVMGAAAFVMADFLRVPYSDVLLAALVPALLYFGAVFIQIDRLAARHGIRGLSQAGEPVLQTMRAGLHFTLPFIVLFIAFLAFAARPQAAALYAIGTVIVIGMLRGYRGRRLGLRDIIRATSNAGVAAVPVILVTAAASLLIGLINITGISVSLALDAIAISGGNAFALLVIVAITAIILGMGMPTVAVYILLATLLAPALTQAGYGGVESHLFILYFGMLSMVTPPIALASITAANIANTGAWATSWRALGLAWVAYVVPFLFIASPALTLQASPALVALTVASALAGIYAISAATIGFHRIALPALARAALLISGILLFVPPGFGNFALITNLAGAGGFVVLMVLIRPDTRRAARRK